MTSNKIEIYDNKKETKWEIFLKKSTVAKKLYIWVVENNRSIRFLLGIFPNLKENIQKILSQLDIVDEIKKIQTIVIYCVIDFFVCILHKKYPNKTKGKRKDEILSSEVKTFTKFIASSNNNIITAEIQQFNFEIELLFNPPNYNNNNVREPNLVYVNPLTNIFNGFLPFGPNPNKKINLDLSPGFGF